MIPDATRPTTVLIDSSVWFHSIESEMMASVGEYSENYIRGQFSWLLSLEWLREVSDTFGLPIEMMSPVFTLDCPYKRYWRAKWLSEVGVTEGLDPIIKRKRVTKKRPVEEVTVTPAEPIVYKGGRKFPTPVFSKVKKLTIELIKQSGCHRLQREGYEADDIIAGLVALNRVSTNPHNLIIATVDSDLLGLLDDYTGWYSMTDYRPRVRFNLEHLNQWGRMKGFPEFTEPRQLWEHKALVGDSSDNIPGSASMVTLPAIDLLNPPDEYKLWLDESFKWEADKVFTLHRTYKPDGKMVKQLLKSVGIITYPR